MNANNQQPRFVPGDVNVTSGALQALNAVQQSPYTYVERHVTGDWGTVCPAGARQNEDHLRHGHRLLSEYRLPNGVKLWIITEADRRATTVLLPAEY